MKKSLWQKRIPTLLGLGILLAALVAGVAFFTLTDGPITFTPRAAPETTPRNIKVTNLTDTSVTISFLTTEATTGFVKYGTEPGALRNQAADDRDQVTGTVGDFTLHHITLRGLSPNTTYYYELGTEGRNTFNNDGSPFTVKTAQRAGAPPAAKTIYGSVVDPNGVPAEGLLVYVNLEGAGELSTYTKESGNYAIPLSTARKPDGSGFAQFQETQALSLTIQGERAELKSTLTTTIDAAQPVDTITLGQDGPAVAEQPEQPAATQTGAGFQADQSLPGDGTGTQSPPPTSKTTPLETAGGTTRSLSGTGSTTLTSTSSGTTTSLSGTDNTATINVVNLDEPGEITVEDGQPVITGSATPQALITIQVNSETQITQQVTAAADGTFELDLAQLGQTLEPGEHTVTITYTDEYGVEQQVTKTFYVPQTTTSGSAASSTSSTAGSGSTATLANTSTSTSSGTTTNGTGTGGTESLTPFGSSNPVPVGSTSATPSPASGSTTATRSSMPATTSAVPVSGSVNTTFALIFGGAFFLIAAAWSAWVGRELQPSLATAYTESQHSMQPNRKQR